MKIISFLDYLSIITGTIRIIILSHQSVSILIQSLLNVIVNEGWKKSTKKYKSDTKTNRPESALSENIKLIDFRTFVHPKIRTPKIRTRNPYKKSVPKIHIKNSYRKFVHENIPSVCKKSKFCQTREFTKPSRVFYKFTLSMIFAIFLKWPFC